MSGILYVQCRTYLAIKAASDMAFTAQFDPFKIARLAPTEHLINQSDHLIRSPQPASLYIVFRL
jgi:hypothetical protein